MKAVLVIEFDMKVGRVQIPEAPWNDGVLFMGMLEMAKLAFHESRRATGDKAKMESQIIVPPMMPPKVS